MLKILLLVILTGILVSTTFTVKDTYTLTPSYSVLILGTSNLRNWKDSVGSVTGEMVADLNEDGSVSLYSIEIKMKVRSIKSNIGTALDNKTYRALKADANPEITFTVDVPVKIMQVDPGGQSLSLKGFLTLAGKCRPVIMQVNALKLEQGKLLFEGSQKINMTDYGIKPPTALLGTLRAHPAITILFKTNFTNKKNDL